jgi:Lon protease-like protein
MALLKPGWEKSYYAKPAIEPVVCVGRIVSHEKLPDGKYNFLLEGIARARIVHELAIDVAYRIAELTPIEQIPASESSLQEQRQRMIELFTKTALAQSGVGQQFGQMFARGWPTADIGDLAAFTFLDDVMIKQSLLAEPDVRARVDQLIDHLQRIGDAQPRRARASSASNPSLN